MWYWGNWIHRLYFFYLSVREGINPCTSVFKRKCISIWYFFVVIQTNCSRQSCWWLDMPWRSCDVVVMWMRDFINTVQLRGNVNVRITQCILVGILSQSVNYQYCASSPTADTAHFTASWLHDLLDLRLEVRIRTIWFHEHRVWRIRKWNAYVRYSENIKYLNCVSNIQLIGLTAVTNFCIWVFFKAISWTKICGFQL